MHGSLAVHGMDVRIPPHDLTLPRSSRCQMKLNKCDMSSSIADLGLHALSSLCPLSLDDIFYNFNSLAPCITKNKKICFEISVKNLVMIYIHHNELRAF